MASQVEIMNMALLQLGDEIILTTTENTKAARTMMVLWDITVRECLEDHTWGFAKKRATLGLLAGTPTYEFDYAYQLPTDFIRLVHMGEPADEYDWRIEGDTLLTNETVAEILYIRYISDTSKWNPKFVSAVSLLLAAKAANSIAGLSTDKRRELTAAYEKTIMDAGTVDSQNSTSPINRPNRWIDARL
jgi:hypothetical protein